MKSNYKNLFLLGALILMSGIIAACGGDSASSDADPTATSPAAAPTAPPTEIPPTAEPTATTAPVATIAPTKAPDSEPAAPSSEEQIAQGKEIFEKTAGGVGCALCHGLDAKGDPAQGAPSNLGASWESIEQALYDRPQMSFISLTRDEIKAVAAYLQWLEAQQ